MSIPHLNKKFLILTLISFYLFLIISPIIVMFYKSITKKGELTIQIYKQVLTDKRIWKIFSKTVTIATCSAILTTIIGFLLAYILERTSVFFNKWVKKIYFLPLIIPSYFMAFSWIKIFNNLPVKFNPYGISTTIFVMTLSYFPLSTLIFIAGLRNFDYRLEEAANLLTNKLKTFRKIIFPLLLPYILTSLIIIFILFFSEYAMVELLRVNTYAFETFIQFSAFHDFKKATAIALPPLAITLLLILVMGKIMSNKPYVTIGGNYQPAPLHNLGKITFPAMFFVFILLILSIICPIGVLIKLTASWKNYITAFKSSIDNIIFSLFLSFIAASIGIVIYLLTSYTIEKSKGILKQTLNILTLLPFAIPGTVIGIGLIKFWNQPSTIIIYSSFISLLIGYLIRFSPYGTRIILSSFKSIDKELEESASLIPVSKLVSFYKIILPLLFPFAVIIWLVSFIFFMKELPTTLLIIPPGKSTLPIKIESMLHIGNEQTIAALCLIHITIIFIVFLMFLPYTKLRKE